MAGLWYKLRFLAFFFVVVLNENPDTDLVHMIGTTLSSWQEEAPI